MPSCLGDLDERQQEARFIRHGSNAKGSDAPRSRVASGNWTCNKPARLILPPMKCSTCSTKGSPNRLLSFVQRVAYRKGFLYFEDICTVRATQILANPQTLRQSSRVVVFKSNVACRSGASRCVIDHVNTRSIACVQRTHSHLRQNTCK